MAGSPGLRVIAEGVETLAIAEQLQGMGCDEARGDLYAKPMPAPELERWLQAHGTAPLSPTGFRAPIPTRPSHE